MYSAQDKCIEDLLYQVVEGNDISGIEVKFEKTSMPEGDVYDFNPVKLPNLGIEEVRRKEEVDFA